MWIATISIVSQTKLKKDSIGAEDAGERAKAPPTWHWVLDGVVDAALLGPPASLFEGRRPQGHRHRTAADDPVHYSVVEPRLRREASRHSRAIPEGDDRGNPLLQDQAV